MRSADIKFGTSDWSARERTPLCIFRITETSDWSGGTQPPFRPAESLGDVSGRTKLSSSLGEGVWQEDLQEMIGSAGRAATRVGGTVFSKAWIGGRRRPPSPSLGLCQVQSHFLLRQPIDAYVLPLEDGNLGYLDGISLSAESPIDRGLTVDQDKD